MKRVTDPTDMAQPKDIGLFMHRVTQYLITGMVGIILFFAQDMVDSLKHVEATVIRMEERVADHDEDIKEIKLTLKDLKK